MFLLIDDTPSNLEALQYNLSGVSSEPVICATTLETGLAQIAKYPKISTVFLDLRLPGVTDLEALQAVSARLVEVGNRSAIVQTMSMFPSLRKDMAQHGEKRPLDTRKLLDSDSNYLSLVLAISGNASLISKLSSDLEAANKKMADPWILWHLARKNPFILSVLGLLFVTNEPLFKAGYQAVKKFLGQ